MLSPSGDYWLVGLEHLAACLSLSRHSNHPASKKHASQKGL